MLVRHILFGAINVWRKNTLGKRVKHGGNTFVTGPILNFYESIKYLHFKSGCFEQTKIGFEGNSEWKHELFIFLFPNLYSHRTIHKTIL